MTPEQWIYLVGGLGVAWWLHRTFLARAAPATAPAVPLARPPSRPAEAPPLDLGQLCGLVHQRIEADGTALAFSRKAAEMVEARAASVHVPWAAPAPPKPDPPKA